MEKFRTPQLSLIHKVLQLAKDYSKHQELILKEFGISHEQLNILIILHYDSDEPSLSLEEVQQKMVLATTNASRLVNKLNDKKLIKRKTDNSNRRKVKIIITEKGILTVTSAVKKMKIYANKLTPLTTEDEADIFCKKLQEFSDTILDWH